MNISNALLIEDVVFDGLEAFWVEEINTQKNCSLNGTFYTEYPFTNNTLCKSTQPRFKGDVDFQKMIEGVDSTFFHIASDYRSDYDFCINEESQTFNGSLIYNFER